MIRSAKEGRKELAKRLRELRNARGLTRAAIGERLGLAHTYISRIEHGKVIPQLPLLEKLANVLEVELYQLFLLGGAQPEAPKLPETIPDGAQERSLLQAFREMSREDRSVLLFMARKLVSRASEEQRANPAEQAQHSQSGHPTEGFNHTIGPDSDSTSPVTPIAEQRISMPEPEWAKATAQEFKASRAQAAQKDAELQVEQRIRRGPASRLWTEVREVVTVNRLGQAQSSLNGCIN